MRLTTRGFLLATGLATVTLAAPAPAAEFTFIPVPEGKIEHTVELIDFTASYTVAGQVPRYERVERNRNILVRELESLSPLARRVAATPDVVAALPRAHHFGHR